mgnify:CR=1 FL=1
MAYTRIHAIKATVDRSIAYICNPDKTDGELFVSSYGCSARTAALEFAFANGKTTGNDGNLAHHLIQSFAPGEVSFEEAHQIGMDFMKKTLNQVNVQENTLYDIIYDLFFYAKLQESEEDIKNGRICTLEELRQHINELEVKS